MKTLVLILLLLPNIGKSQVAFQNALLHLNTGLEHSNISFKEAVYTVEEVFLEQNDYREFMEERVSMLKAVIQIRLRLDSLVYKGKDYSKIELNAALFKVITDTTSILVGDTAIYTFTPYRYDFDDIFGSKNWSNMSVYKLLQTHKGNCHSLPYLYKILSDEMGGKAYLALAPNHVYIKHRADKGGMYNTELTSASFPIDAWLMASGYISLEAVQKATYLDTLSAKESLSLCVIDLAQGYIHKYPDNDGKFVIECCNLALKYFPNYVNAILLKAETRLKQLQTMQKRYGYEYLKEVIVYPEAKALWDEMNSLYMKLYTLGYRQMPEQMYVEWLTSLKTEKEKYTNKQAPGAIKD